MAKNTHAQEVATGTSDSYTAEEASDPLLELRNRPVLGGEHNATDDPDVNEGDKPSVGNNSAASSETESSENERETCNLQPVAPVTENRSDPSSVESDTARSADGNTQETREPSVKRATKAATPRKATGGANRGTRAANPADDDF